MNLQHEVVHSAAPDWPAAITVAEGVSLPFYVPGTERPLAPVSSTWRQVTGPSGLPMIAGATAITLWEHRANRLRVLSTVELAEYPDGSGKVGPQFHLSIVRFAGGKLSRPGGVRVRFVATAFRVPRIEVDNHHPGNAQHLWCPVDPAHRVDCECKVGETTITEPDGYKWQDDPSAAGCRLCEVAVMTGVPCHRHPRARSVA